MDYTMTIRERTEHLLEESRRLHGEDAFSTQCLKKWS
jgi:hypothetical protein